MACSYFALLKTTLQQIFAKKLEYIYKYCCITGVTLLNVKNFYLQLILKYQNLPLFYLPVSPGCVNQVYGTRFLHNNNHIGFTKMLFCLLTVPWCFLLSFITYFLSSNHLQKIRNLQISVEKLVEKGSINLLNHLKPAAYIINIIINVLIVAFECSSLSCQLLRIYYLLFLIQ